MKLKASVLSVLLCCFVFQINAQNIETKTHTIKDVKSIAVDGNVDIHIKQGNSKTVKIEATAKQHKQMQVKIKGNAVSVSCKEGKRMDKPVQVYLEVENLNALAGSGGADVYFDNRIQTQTLNIALSGGSDLLGTIEADKFTCATSGGSDIDLKKVDVKEIQITSSGGSDVTVKEMSATKVSFVISGGSDVDVVGRCDDMTIIASGGSDFMGNRFKAKKSSIVVSGGSDAHIHVTEELSVIASGSSDITCEGKPNIKDEKIGKGSDFMMK
ncbi:MAG: DUF2807 domain-containing protein [Saprospiraceae bacterium]